MTVRDEKNECRACLAGLPLVWHVQSKKTMHLGQGLSTISCARLDCPICEAPRQRLLGVDQATCGQSACEAAAAGRLLR